MRIASNSAKVDSKEEVLTEDKEKNPTPAYTFVIGEDNKVRQKARGDEGKWVALETERSECECQGCGGQTTNSSRSTERRRFWEATNSPTFDVEVPEESFPERNNLRLPRNNIDTTRLQVPIIDYSNKRHDLFGDKNYRNYPSF